jgi:hypothetical protein
LLHSFFLGLVFFAELGFTAYALVIFANSVARLEGGFASIIWTRQVVLLVAFLSLLCRDAMFCGVIPRRRRQSGVGRVSSGGNWRGALAG